MLIINVHVLVMWMVMYNIIIRYNLVQYVKVVYVVVIVMW